MKIIKCCECGCDLEQREIHEMQGETFCEVCADEREIAQFEMNEWEFLGGEY